LLIDYRMEIPIRVDQRTQQSFSDPFCADLKAHHACCLPAGNEKRFSPAQPSTQRSSVMTRIEQSIEVNAPVRAAYNQWTQFEDFPRFMEGVREVRQLDDAHLHWRADRNGNEVEWDSEIVDQVPDRHIAWRDISGPRNSGSVSFYPVHADKTRVHMTMECEPAVAPSQAAHAEQVIAQRLEQDLARFKKLLETRGTESGAWRGEIHSSQPVGSSSGAAGDAVNNPEPAAAGRAAAAPTEEASRGDADPRAAQDAQTRNTINIEGQDGSTQDRTGGAPSWLPNLLQGWDEPVAMIKKMSEEMEQLFERFIGRPMASRLGQGGMTGKWMPPLEVSQRGSSLVICVDLPGVKMEDVRIEIDEAKLTIEGERREEVEKSVVQGYRRSERSYGHFYRMIPLPHGVDPDAVRASMRDGVLEITIPVPVPEPAVRRGRRIDIQPPGS
jgi:HSP20 family molecular chaperone IbpA/uncharacterized membrane protein